MPWFRVDATLFTSSVKKYICPPHTHTLYLNYILLPIRGLKYQSNAFCPVAFSDKYQVCNSIIKQMCPLSKQQMRSLKVKEIRGHQLLQKHSAGFSVRLTERPSRLCILKSWKRLSQNRGHDLIWSRPKRATRATLKVSFVLQSTFVNMSISLSFAARWHLWCPREVGPGFGDSTGFLVFNAPRRFTQVWLQHAG